MDLKNKLIIISGGASGIGAAVAKKLTDLGAIVGILDTNIVQAQKLALSIQGITQECDVRSSAQVQNSISEIIKFTKYPLRVAINCAGIAPAQRVVPKQDFGFDDDIFQKLINVNLVGTYNVIRVAANIMSKMDALDNGERGVIINTASVAAFEGQIGQVAYSASKAGIIGMMLPAVRELSRFGIRVMTIAPGVFETPLVQTFSSEIKNKLKAQVPFPPRLGQPEEYANLAAHIIENTYLNGETIRIDGAIRLP